MEDTIKLTVQGIVQGVGFRPTVYRYAKENQLNGTVRNLGNAVEIILQGHPTNIKQFTQDLQEKKPPISQIRTLTQTPINTNKKYTDFTILESKSNFSGTSIIPPDVSICTNCLNEMNNPENRRYEYPFTACTDCGPRFTVIKSIPYDRERTSMDKFPLCNPCNTEYTNPLDRRYHAEASCCNDCGPQLQLYNKNKEQINTNHPIKETAKLLDQGHTFAIKGIGGTHLVSSVQHENTVKQLRKNLGRHTQPFACMSPDIKTIKKFAYVKDYEAKTLESRRRPIVILKKNNGYNFAPSVAPYLHNIGIMLPYTGLHYLLFKYGKSPAYIMTSANMPGEPMLKDNKEIMDNLDGIVDYYLLHDREIVNRCDDSVIRYRAGDLSFIRRSRGYTPEPYDISHINNKDNILALGPELDVTFAIVKEGLSYISQHIGNTNKFATFEFLKDAVNHMMGLLKVDEYDAIACDMHPLFFTSKLAKEYGEKYDCPVIPVQHHHAHAVSLAVDNKVDELVCITADGVGYGEDGNAWGGEVLYTDIGNYKRCGSLQSQPMAGGDLCTTYPIRMLSSVLYNYYTRENLDLEELNNGIKSCYGEYFQYGDREVDMVFKQLDKDFNIQYSSSTGRVLDSVASALGICSYRGYEGECSMRLESVAYKAKGDLEIPFKIIRENKMDVVDTGYLLNEVYELANKKDVDIPEVAYAAQRSVVEGLAEIGVRGANKMGVELVGGSGGVFYNEAISKCVRDYVLSNGLDFIQHQNTCAGDGSLSLGQSVVAGFKL